MTEFISRKYGHEGYEVIIKTTDHEHDRATEEFARRLIDHAKPMTNGDRIRAMTDEELAAFMKSLLEQGVPCFGEGEFPYHPCNQDHNCTKCGIEWLQEPVKGDAE